MRVLSITNQKGGCGKTTTAVHLAACLAAKGHSTLLVDLDPQGHAGLALGIGGAKPLEASTYEVLTRRQPLEAILHEVSERLAVAPSDVRLSAVEQELSGVEGREYRLSEALASLEQNRFPFVVIDTPPSIGLLTFNALIASPEVLVPIDGSIFSLQGLDRLRETIAIVDRHVGRATTVRALATIYDRRTRLAREVLEEIRTRFGDWALHTVIHETVKLREAASQGKSILEICPSSIAAEDHHSLAAELLQAATRRGTRTEAVSPAFSLHGGAPVTPAAALAPKVAAVPAETPTPSGQIAPRAPIAATAPIAAASSIRAARAGGTRFVYPDGTAEAVAVAGSWNGWEPQPCKKVGDRWEKTILLSPGVYEYRFVVDGHWTPDPSNERRAESPYGGHNSVVEIAGHGR